MMRRKALFICGSLNQTSMAHAVAGHLSADFDCFFTPYYCDGWLKRLADMGWLDFTILGGQFRARTEAYLQAHHLPLDEGGRKHDYDLVVTTTDILIQHNIRDKPIVLIQEGMTDPETPMFYLVRWLRLPRWLAGNTSSTGLSDAYRAFCVASEGYRDLFVRKGVNPAKIRVTGIPNYDDAARFLDNDFPHRGYVLVATSDVRESKRLDRRKRFIRRALEIAAGRPIIFKLHPNERVERATREIKALAPHALIYADGNIHHMIANCDVLITQYSTVVYIGLALGKEVHSYFDLELLRRLMPIQNGGTSARNIAAVCRQVVEESRG